MKIGDVVELKSGSPKATVIQVVDGNVAIIYCDVNGVMHDAVVPLSTLYYVTKETLQ